jgi:hypothetical protein
MIVLVVDAVSILDLNLAWIRLKLEDAEIPLQKRR